MSVRAALQRVIDELQFRFDVFPQPQYQPLPWIGLNQARRGEGTVARWQAIEGSLHGHTITSALDIGCDAGYFCFALAQRGISVLGIEVATQSLRIAEYASRKIGTPRVGFCNLTVNMETVSLLPKVDLILVMAIWHHWVRSYGLEAAGHILSSVWEKCNQVLFFETGETEMPAEFGLPAMVAEGRTARDWLEAYLGATCPGAEIVHLGTFKAFAPGGDERRNVVYRNLFMLTRLDESRPPTDVIRASSLPMRGSTGPA